MSPPAASPPTASSPAVAEAPLVDTHVHFFDLAAPGLRWSWLEPGVSHPVVGDVSGIASRRYGPPELVAESRTSGVAAVVHVQAALGTPDPVAESEWARGLTERYGLPQAVVAGAELRGAGAEAVVARQAAVPGVRAVRDLDAAGHLADPALHRGVAAVARLGLVLDVACRWEDFGALRDLADRFPDLVVVLEHAGVRRRDPRRHLGPWRQALHELARAGNIVVKVSGLGLLDPRWTVETWRPVVHECLAAFGPRRAMLGSNWPLDRLASSYPDVVAAYRTLLADLADDEQRAVLSGTAERVYGLAPVSGSGDPEPAAGLEPAGAVSASGQATRCSQRTPGAASSQ